MWIFIAFGTNLQRNEEPKPNWSLKVPTPGRPQFEILAAEFLGRQKNWTNKNAETKIHL